MKKTKLLLLAFALLLFPLNVFASTNTQSRYSLPNYGVSKKWEITDSNRSNVLNTKKVDASEKIYDFADIFSEYEEKDLFYKIEEFTKKHNMDLVVLTDKFSYSNDKENEDYAADFYDYNDFGIDFDKYNGIIIFINMNPTDRYFNFYMFGNSQLYFDNKRKEEPIDTTMQYMKNGKYFIAIEHMMDLFDEYLDKGIPYDLEGYYVDDMGYLQKNPNFKRPFRPPWVGIIGADLIIVLITMIILIKKNRMVKKKLVMTEYVNKNGADYRVKTDQFIRSFVTSHTVSSSSGGHSGGGFSSSGGSSGGGHSSGGGGHF